MPEFKKDTRGFRMKGWSPFTKVNPIQPVEVKIKGGEGKSRRKADDPALALNMHPDAPFVKKSPMKFVSFSYSSRTSSGPEPKEEKSSSGIKDQVYGTVDSKSAFNKNGDDDTDKMTKKEQRKHRREVLKYNRKTAKPLNPTQKARIRKQLENMDIWIGIK